jgi:hypothetical protein
MILIVLFGHSSGFKNLISHHNNYRKARSRVCCFILVRFGNGYDAVYVLYAKFMLKFDVNSLAICILKVYISFNRDLIN